MAQQNGRKWLAFEYEESYLEGPQYRFQDAADIAELRSKSSNEEVTTKK